MEVGNGTEPISSAFPSDSENHKGKREKPDKVVVNLNSSVTYSVSCT